MSSFQFVHFSRDVFNFFVAKPGSDNPGAAQPQGAPVEHLLHWLGSRAGVM